MNMYLKLFLGMGIPYGIFMGISSGIFRGVESGIKSGAISGLIFGLIMALIFGTINKSRAKKMGYAGDVGPKQSKTIEINTSLDKAFEKCIQALIQFGAKIQSQNKTKFEIKARSKISWKSWGEVLTLQISDIENYKVKIEISSSPALITTLVDYGKGRENVEKISQILTSENI